jgi:hypothetical protein
MVELRASSNSESPLRLRGLHLKLVVRDLPPLLIYEEDSKIRVPILGYEDVIYPEKLNLQSRFWSVTRQRQLFS